MKGKGRPVPLPIHGDSNHNSGFLLAIGGLVVNWANNESLFLAMLQCLIGHEGQSAAIIWNSHRASHQRLELLLGLSKERVTDEVLLEDIVAAVKQFKGYSRTRNFFCHALYNYDSELRLRSATGVTVPKDGDAITFQTKPMDRATANEITDATVKLAAFNRELWKLLERLERALGVQLANRPQLPHDAK